jgi:hypothetical protein
VAAFRRVAHARVSGLGLKTKPETLENPHILSKRTLTCRRRRRRRVFQFNDTIDGP